MKKTLRAAILLLLLLALAACGEDRTPPENTLPKDTSSGDYATSLMEQYLQEPVLSCDKLLEDQPIYEGLADLYLVRTDRGEEYLALRKDAYLGHGYQYVLGTLQVSREEDPEKALQDIVWNVQDIDTCLLVEPFGRPAGGGSHDYFFGIASEEEREETVLEGWEPIYAEGDFWFRVDYPDLTALCYNSTQEGRVRTWTVETTREDIYTWHGIRIGSTRDEVIAAYPAELLHDTELYPYEGDYLWYNKRSADGLGIDLIFYFEDDKVAKLQTVNMFN